MTPKTSPSTAARTPLTLRLYLLGAWVLGWWLLSDGLRQRLFGHYTEIGGRLGPWADLARAAGFDPAQLPLFFVALGAGLLGAGFGVVKRRAWGYYTALLLSALALLYLGWGTLVALACLVLLLLPPSRRYIHF
ncbi:MAG: hypothetical protein IT317_10765 [Anaerolineales bacterium]|nr:hypothetical protein [Anaerolineales bacterium]